jgi:arsenite/tail-anchored protein-transporting ATPase
MRIVLVTGKGGAGKTTVAAATALSAGRAGLKTLLLGIGDGGLAAAPLETEAGPEPVEIGGSVFVARLDERRRLDHLWPAVAAALTWPVDGLDTAAAAERAVLPDVQELLAVQAVAEHARSGRFDALVVDCPSTVQTVRCLAAPETLGWYLQRVAPRSALFPAAMELLEQLRLVREALADPLMTSVRLVVTAESAAVAQARRARTALALYGYPLESVTVNRVAPPHGGPGGAALRESQRELLAAIDRAFSGVPTCRVGLRAQAPVRLAELFEVADDLADGSWSGDRTPPAERVRVSPDGEQFTLCLPLPLAAGRDVTLGRSGDYLVITVSGWRRFLVLPSVLRRCVAVGATFERAQLVVRFERDAALWPREAVVT